MEIILIGNRREIRRWIRRQERMSGEKIGFVGVSGDNGQDVVCIAEGTKENCPRMRTVKRHIERSEEISE